MNKNPPPIGPVPRVIFFGVNENTLYKNFLAYIQRADFIGGRDNPQFPPGRLF